MNKSDSERIQMVSDFLEHGDDCYAEAQYYSESKQCQDDLRRIADTIERKAVSDEEIPQYRKEIDYYHDRVAYAKVDDFLMRHNIDDTSLAHGIDSRYLKGILVLFRYEDVIDDTMTRQTEAK